MIDPEDLTEQLGRLWYRFYRLLDRRMAEQGASISQTKLLCFIALQGGSVRAADIADCFGYAPRTVTQAIDGLERDGLVQRNPDPVDRRAKQITVTARGTEVAQTTEPMRVALMNSIFGSLGAAEQERFAATMAKLNKAIEGVGG